MARVCSVLVGIGGELRRLWGVIKPPYKLKSSSTPFNPLQFVLGGDYANKAKCICYAQPFLKTYDE